MPAPLPQFPVTIPTAWSDRGNTFLNEATKSSKQRVSGFVQQNVCDQNAYYVFGAAMNINQNTDDCQNVLASGLSLNLRVPYEGATNATILAHFDALVAAIRVDLNARIIEIGVGA